ncbi:hypothetical protein [Clostridium perfringens]|uniref:hypothetical protein n=1 Tax=Clostridium perfringens TaxID=1502 RepID=UPI0030CE3967
MFKNLIDKILNKKSIKAKNQELIDNCKDEFDKYQYEENYEIETIKEIYTHIYNGYVKKLKEGNLNIKLEKIRIEKSLAKHKKTSEKLDAASITLVIGIITIILNSIMDFFKSQLTSYHISKDWLFALILIIFALVMRSIENENKKSRAYERDLVNYISLKVLNDIEKGIVLD